MRRCTDRWPRDSTVLSLYSWTPETGVEHPPTAKVGKEGLS
jgi:hypothetical protein